MQETIEEILGSPIGVNAAHWLRWADDWWGSNDFWALYEICVIAALRVSEGIDTPDSASAHDPELRHSAHVLAEVLDHHPLARHLATASSPQVHFGSLSNIRSLHFRLTGGSQKGRPDGAFWTSSLLDQGRASWRAAIESSYVPVDLQTLLEYRISFDPTRTRIFNIDNLGDVASLARGYGTRETGRLHIDWNRVADDYDGVHLSFRGLLTAQGVTVGHGDETVKLHGWDCESTAWFNREHFTEAIRVE